MLRVLIFVMSIVVNSAAFGANPKVIMTTNLGEVEIELYAEAAPVTVENFLRYVESGFYTDTIFHRVIPGFMVQGGGYSQTFAEKTTYAPITNEADNGLENKIGSIAMARTNRPHSATAQFFINVENNSFLNHRGKSVRDWGYAVFGEVVRGMDVIKAIENSPTGSGGPFVKDVPKKTITIQNINVIGN